MDYSEYDALLGRRERKKRNFRTFVAVMGGTILGVGVLVTLVLVTRSSGTDTEITDSTETARLLQQSNSETTTRRTFGGGGGGRRSSSGRVRTPLGRVQGVNLTSRDGREYFAYYNVPYAQPPLGDLRFELPQPVEKWEGTYNATVKGTPCMQRKPGKTEAFGSEDCLYLNIYTPKIGRRSNFPVLIYFFGGAFMFGDANDFNVDYFMDEDVILVIPQYRLRALGFLSTGDEIVPGNMGLKDQIQAMKWIQENIKPFGGDPNKIVPLGTSAGAMACHSHLLTPLTNGLISGSVSLSGVALVQKSSLDLNPWKRAVKLGTLLNCTTDNSTELVQCLRNVSASSLIEAFIDFPITVEEDSETAYFPDTPVNLMVNGKVNPLPWMVGVTSAEEIYDSYVLLMGENSTNSLNNDFNNFAKGMLSFNAWNDEKEVEDILTNIEDFYFGDELLGRNESSRFNLTNLIGDRTMYHPTKTAALLHANKGNPVFLYYLTKEANVSFIEIFKKYYDPPYGVSHADDVQYIFSRPGYPYIPKDSEWYPFSKMMVSFIVSFAATGAPVNPLENGTVWEQVDPADNGTVMFNLDDNPTFIQPLNERMELWDSIDFQLLYNSSFYQEDEEDDEVEKLAICEMLMSIRC